MGKNSEQVTYIPSHGPVTRDILFPLVVVSVPHPPTHTHAVQPSVMSVPQLTASRLPVILDQPTCPI